eukprot:Skav235428  [mRNA]  locus=scaffold473:122151:123257:- [translate_table: standard]
MNPEEPQVAELMVSHSWLECMDQCSEALNKYCTRQKLLRAVILWFCAFAQYQPGDESGDRGPTVAEQLSMDPFGSVIRNLTPSSLGMVVIQTSSADVYTRLWCVYEIAEATGAKVPVKMAYSQQALETRNGSFEEMLRAKTSRASCRDPADEKMIREKVQQLGGFCRLDCIIFEFRLRAFEEMMHELQESTREQLRSEIQKLTRLDIARAETVMQFATGGLAVMAGIPGSTGGTGGVKWMLCCVPLVIALVCLVAVPFIAMASNEDVPQEDPRPEPFDPLNQPISDAPAAPSHLWLWVLVLGVLALAVAVGVYACRWGRRKATAEPPGPEPELVGRSTGDEEEPGESDEEVMQQRMAMAREMAPQLFS